MQVYTYFIGTLVPAEGPGQMSGCGTGAND